MYLGDKLRICHLQKDDAHHPAISQIQVTLFLNGRQFLFQFHIINNVPYQAVRGRDFLQSNGAIINFSKGTLKLDKTNPLKMTLGEEHTRPLTILTVGR